MQFGPRYPARLLDVIERLSSERAPIAEINRRVGAEAERLGLPRPSYERVRELDAELVLVGLSGRGDKDLAEALAHL